MHGLALLPSTVQAYQSGGTLTALVNARHCLPHLFQVLVFGHSQAGLVSRHWFTPMTTVFPDTPNTGRTNYIPCLGYKAVLFVTPY